LKQKALDAIDRIEKPMMTELATFSRYRIVADEQIYEELNFHRGFNIFL
jgi:hypothetical protein